MKNILILVPLILSCNTAKKQTSICNVKAAIEIADKKVRKNINSLNRTVTESVDSFLITYTLKDSTLRGGGAQLKISKEGCRIIDQKFYQ